MSYECNKSFCNKLNWVQDEHDANHYICLKCGRDRWVDSFRRWGAVAELLWPILAGLFVVFLLAGCGSISESDEYSPPKIINLNPTIAG